MSAPLHLRALQAYLTRSPEDAHLPLDDFLLEFIDREINARTAKTPEKRPDLPVVTPGGYKPNHDFYLPF